MKKNKKKVIILVLVFILLLGGLGYGLTQFTDEEKDYSSQDSEASGGDMSKKTIYKFNASDYVFDHFGYCNIRAKEDCKNNIPPTPYPEMIEDLDKLYFLASLQGLVNRNGPELWVSANPSSRYEGFWWNNFRDGSKPYGFLSDYQVVELNSFQEVLNTFSDNSTIRGVVEYDTKYNGAGLNVAKTVAGADNLVIVREGSSVRNQIVAAFGGANASKVTKLPTFKHKPHAYEWALNNYLLTGKSDPSLIEYNLDAYPIKVWESGKLGGNNSPLFTFDYIIMKKGFSVDLSHWEGEKPVDDKTQSCGADRRMFEKILRSARNKIDNDPTIKNKMIAIWGYVPWFWKYYGENQTGRGIVCGDISDWCYKEANGTCNEESFTQLISNYGAFGNGSGSSLFGTHPSNLSVMHWGDLPDEKYLVNPTPPSRNELISKGYLKNNGEVSKKTYVLAYFGDYEHDGTVAMMHGASPYPWDGREQAPGLWSYSATAQETIPAVVNYMAHTRGDKVYFGGGFTGAGYTYPNYIPSNLIDEFANHSAYYYSSNLWNMTGVLAAEGNHHIEKPDFDVLNYYSAFSNRGIVTYMDRQNGRPRLFKNVPNVAFKSPGTAAGKSPDEIANKLSDDYEKAGGKPRFIPFRNIFYGPDIFKKGFLIEKNRRQDRKYELVDPETFFSLIRLSLGGNNNNKATFYMKDRIPDSLIAGEEYEFTIIARNDGWNNWYGLESPLCNSKGDKKGCYSLGYKIIEDLPEPVSKGGDLYVKNKERVEMRSSELSLGDEYEFTFSVKMPHEPGTYFLFADIVNELNYWFEYQGNQPMVRRLNVAPKSIVAPPILEDCTNRECGQAPNGENCGSCDGEETCNPSGECVVTAPVCTPNCGNKECGSDGCGGSCGNCTVGYFCNSGQCEEEVECSLDTDCESGECLNGKCQDSPIENPNELEIDLNGDGKVGVADYAVFKNDWISYYEDGELDDRSDLNGDGKLSVIDYSIFKKKFMASF